MFAHRLLKVARLVAYPELLAEKLNRVASERTEDVETPIRTAGTKFQTFLFGPILDSKRRNSRRLKAEGAAMDVEKALRDYASKLRDEVQELKSENEKLRQEVERLTRQAGEK